MANKKHLSEIARLNDQRKALFEALKDMVNEYECSQKIERNTLLIAKIVLLKVGANK